MLIVHVDDFLCCGPRQEVDSLLLGLSKALLLKTSPELKSGESMTFLGRVLTRTGNAMVIAPSPKLLQKVAAHYGLSETSHAVSTPRDGKMVWERVTTSCLKTDRRSSDQLSVC